MKILLTIHERLTPNAGAAGSTFQLGQHYLSLGHDVTYYSFNDLPQWMPDRLKEVVFPGYLAVHLVACLRRGFIDVVDASTGDVWWWALFLRGERRRPLLSTRSHYLEQLIHLDRLEEQRRGSLKLSWQYPLYRGSLQLLEVAISLRRSDLVLLLNHLEAECVVQQLGVSESHVHIVANGIPESFLGLPLLPMTEAEHQGVAIALVGTYITRKGIQYSVPALNNILKRYPQVRVSFLGTGCSESKVLDDFEVGVRDRITVLPHFEHADLPSLLEDHHIQLFPSLSEAFGKGLVEAMACGLAPITTETAGPLEIVKDGYDAIVVPIRDQAAIEAGLEKLLSDLPFLVELRANAYRTAQRFSWQRTAEHRLTLYKNALQDRQSTSGEQNV
ncbi:D-inositol 3-phosphate glycosyltransferase [Acaryochloris thomasi RCC1774]|uniref:D-inositol 3-phosphate glycosyltransferase n=1 Tax=Acaryochloris thomasi RCC1774 TaxID=1764569 RepID=A0A2W1JCU8_9CYAN|nr:glycosyltransferase family 4 protein [Acaryochloris thomasi]PZD71626.1 D-inositol 3-phosphate glycosyltransferase [Acaryochloris thomasi RCC1774]